MSYCCGGVGMAGVQSVPRVMRGAPVIRPVMFDVPLPQRDLGSDAGSMSKTTMLMAAISAVGLIYYLSKRR